MLSALSQPHAVDSICIKNFIAGSWVDPQTEEYMNVICPHNGAVIGKVAVSDYRDVNDAVCAALKAFPVWSGLTVKSRAAVMLKFHNLMNLHLEELSELVVQENGKNIAEARASVAKGIETVEWACSIPQLCQGKILQVSKGIECRDCSEPLGVVGCVVPFNFPAMVPMWTIPIALTTGNCVIVKPSEKVPMTLCTIAQLLHKAGVPPGVFQIVNGTAGVVNSLCDHPMISAVTFVGSSKVAEIVTKRCQAIGKRVLALGGAKNHLVALPDCHVASAAQDIVASYAGCAGQRCMAASVLICVGNVKGLIEEIVRLSKMLVPGTNAGEIGAVIDSESQLRILRYVNEAEADGVQILLDGRSWVKRELGTWFGPTILLHSKSTDAAICDEVFGPVLSIICVSSWEEALAIENGNPYGNAASIYTTIGGHAEFFSSRFRAGMIGVNIGIPVPREPFSFGGMVGTRSNFGQGDITGEGALDFFTSKRKITTRWPAVAQVSEKMPVDTASFVGQI